MSGAGLIELLAARLAGGSARRAAPTLREALVTLPERARSSDLAWRTERPLFHASDASIDGPLRPSRRQGFPEPTGISFAESPQQAEQFGAAVYPHFARGELGNAEQFMARAREHMAQGLDSEQAAAATQKEFAELGYAGVRWGTGENVIFNSNDVISALDPQVARAGALSVRPPARSAEQGASVLRDGTFMRPESDYVSAHQSIPTPTLREAVAERIGRNGPDAGPVQGGRTSVADLRARFDPFGADNPWEVAPITEREVRQAMQTGARETRRFDDDGLAWTRQDHINRIATLARDGWDAPIELTSRQGVADGVHRLAAAIVRGDETIATQAAQAGRWGHGDIRPPPTGLRVQMDGTRWQVIDAATGNVVEQLPPGSTFADANRAMARAQPDGGPVQAGRQISVDSSEMGRAVVVSLPNGKTLRFPMQDIDGYISLDNPTLPAELRGQRIGSDIIRAAVDDALAQGRVFSSGGMVSPDGMRLMKSLERAGYDVRRAPDIVDKPIDGYFNSRRYPEPVFTVHGGPNRASPNAGSDRNALQRALRERMERE